MINRVTLIGRVGQDHPEVKYATTGTAVCNFSIATSESWKDKNGDKQEKTEWVKIVAFGRTAEICGEYLTKGKQIYISGKLQTRQWETDNGEKRYTTEVVANVMQMLGGKNDNQDSSGSDDVGYVGEDKGDESIPF